MKRITGHIAMAFTTFFLFSGIGLSYAAGDIFKLTESGTIDANLNNIPLNEALKSLSSRLSIELKGAPAGGEAVNLTVSDTPLEELLKRLMRGYNYVLIKPEGAQKSMLMVLGKAERTKYTPPPPVAAAAFPPTRAPPSGVAGTPPHQPSRMPGYLHPAQQAQQPVTAVPASPETQTGTGPTVAEGFSGTSSGGARRVITDQSLMPPTPPQIAGLDLPPMPPGFAGGQAGAATSGMGDSPDGADTAAASSSQATSAQAVAEMPPQIPTSGLSSTSSSASASGTSAPSLTISTQTPDLRPPAIPF